MKWRQRWRSWRRRIALFGRGTLHIWFNKPGAAYDTLAVHVHVTKGLLAEAEHDADLCELIAEDAKQIMVAVMRKSLCT